MSCPELSGGSIGAVLMIRAPRSAIYPRTSIRRLESSPVHCRKQNWCVGLAQGQLGNLHRLETGALDATGCRRIRETTVE